MAPSIALRAFAAAATLIAAAGLRASEVIREQDAAGQVRVVREVAEDAAGNCVNHGLWQLRTAEGALAAEGRYDMGRRTGTWRRWLSADDVPPALSPTLAGFELPFVSEAMYVAGGMNGRWTIADALGRMCLSVELVDGVRQGELCTWAPTGQVVRRETYDHGLLDGRVFAWSEADQQLSHTASWLQGYHLVRSVAYFDRPQAGPRSEGDYLLGPQSVATPDDFWTTQLAEYRYGQGCLPHGTWRHWHSSGQIAAEGRYAWGRPVGDFVWRHPNGQKAAVGSYAADGVPAGAWRWWNADGAQMAAVTVEPAAISDSALEVARSAAGVTAHAVR